MERTTTAPLSLDEGCAAMSPGSFDLPARDAQGAYSPLKAGFSIELNGDVIPYRLMSAFAEPGQTLEITAIPGTTGRDVSICSKSGTLKPDGERRWRWTAPERDTEGVIHAVDMTTGDSILLRLFILQPYRGEASLEGYRIGHYERVPLYDKPVYRVPHGMLRVTDDMSGIWLSPHFQLGQFLCKQSGGDPRFAIVSTRLLLKLENLLERVNERGKSALSFAILSGFRTPEYNRAIGNTTKYTRHAYGDAADIYTDEDGDGRMDDLDGDGRSDYQDAVWLSRIVEDNLDAPWYAPFIGGLGIYGPRPHRGAFIHVDTRGFLARWTKP